MKLVLINSSGRTGGNTARVLTLFEESLAAGAKKNGVELELLRVNLAQLSLLPCLGCRACFDRGEENCPRKDGLLTLRDQMLDADGYVFASPVYVEDVNGAMKTLIDRLAFVCHRPAFFGKHALVLTTSGIGSSNHALHTMRTALGTWGIRVLRGLKFRLGAISTLDETRVRYGRTINRAANEFMRTLQRPFRPSFYSRIAFSVQQSYWRTHKTEPKSFDHAYWKQSGWLDRGRVYYNPAMAKSLGSPFAYALGKVVARFFG